MRNPKRGALFASAVAGALLLAACGRSAASAPAASAGASAVASSAAENESEQAPAIAAADRALPASQTGGFDGQKAYDFTAKLVSFGPRPPASEAIRHTQDYIATQLKGFGCDVDTDDFHAPTPVGDLAMQNIVAKVPGSGKGIILLLTHYDTLRLDNFVGAEDGGSSSGLMLEMARVLCGSKQRNSNAIWMAFLDGEEDQINFTSSQQAQTTWNTPDTTYGSRELAARMSLSGDVKRITAVILADMVGQKDLQIDKDSNSTPWLQSLVWKTADRLGYGKLFNKQGSSIVDDHQPFLERGVPAVDIIDLNGYIQEGYWHTPQDTMDKISPKNLAIVGHVILVSLGELQQKFR
ncbi:MAG TPA: M28 family peptidase [Candidatus Acidoferrales bacterium]|nr:M28 family peptidase [Candidatus Acidoferrales bacterium]